MSIVVADSYADPTAIWELSALDVGNREEGARVAETARGLLLRKLPLFADIVPLPASLEEGPFRVGDDAARVHTSQPMQACLRGAPNGWSRRAFRRDALRHEIYFPP
jgi:hypothetical protein